jgi:MFS family permease
MRQTAFWPAAIALVGLTLTWGTFNAFVPIFGKEQLGLPSSQVGYLLALQAIVNAVSRIPGGRIVDHAKRRWPIVFVGALGWCTTCAVLGHLTGFVGPALLLVIGTPFVALSFVAVGVVFADLSNSSTRGVTMGMYGTVLFAGLSIGPLLFGPIVQSYGYAAGFTASAIAAMTLIVVMAAMHAEPIRRRTAPAPLGDSETRPEATRQV